MTLFFLIHWSMRVLVYVCLISPRNISVWTCSLFPHLLCFSLFHFLLYAINSWELSYSLWPCSNLVSTLKLKFLLNANRTSLLPNDETLQCLSIAHKIRDWSLWGPPGSAGLSLHTASLLAHPLQARGLLMISGSTCVCSGATVHTASLWCGPVPPACLTSPDCESDFSTNDAIIPTPFLGL